MQLNVSHSYLPNGQRITHLNGMIPPTISGNGNIIRSESLADYKPAIEKPKVRKKKVVQVWDKNVMRKVV